MVTLFISRWLKNPLCNISTTNYQNEVCTSDCLNCDIISVKNVYSSI